MLATFFSVCLAVHHTVLFSSVRTLEARPRVSPKDTLISYAFIFTLITQWKIAPILTTQQEMCAFFKMHLLLD